MYFLHSPDPDNFLFQISIIGDTATGEFRVSVYDNNGILNDYNVFLFKATFKENEHGTYLLKVTHIIVDDRITQEFGDNVQITLTKNGVARILVDDYGIDKHIGIPLEPLYKGTIS
jgi:hypothetical protein